MANINNTKKSLNRVQLMKENNSNLEYLYIDGIKIGAMGSVSDADREAGIKCIQRIVDNSDKSGYALVMEVMAQVNFEASMNEKGIKPDDVVEIATNIHTYPCVLSYKDKALYDELGKEICNVRDIEDDIGERALIEILKARGKAALIEDEQNSNEDDDI